MCEVNNQSYKLCEHVYYMCSRKHVWNSNFKKNAMNSKNEVTCKLNKYITSFPIIKNVFRT